MTTITAENTATATVEATATPASRRWLAFAAVLAASVMDLLDSTITQVAGPTIRDDLGGSYAVLEWVTAAYTLAMAAGLLTGGRLGDVFGRKRVLLTGMAGFVVASAACSLAANPGELIGARAVQGLAAAIMLPQVFGLIRDLFAEHEMGKAFGVFGPVMGLSAMLGPIVSGGLIALNLAGTSWRMIFAVNVPVGLAALVIGARLLPNGDSTKARLNGTSAIIAAIGMFALVYPLAEGHFLGYPTWLLALLATSVPVLAGFARSQVRIRNRGGAPLVEPGIFSSGGYLAGVAFSLVFCASMGGIVLIFNVFLQSGLGYSAWHSAITTAPWALGAFAGSAASGMTMARYGRKVIHVGLIVETIGLLAIYGVLRAAGSGVGTVDLLAPMIVGGAGMGAVFVPLFDIVMVSVSPRHMGSASGVLQSVNSLGMTVGVAGLGAVFFAIAGPRFAGSVSAAEWTALAAVGLLATAFALAFRLPLHARS
jgi:MFS family permease